ncbi:MAG TPA: type II toxin-antitoxin system PemK/MazF family toxin [Actinocrinis sp.]|uniref:type II toxin-antitoxin system PemK/MazF family toxin n=1 Tax=Actinocrinis sp. TaxID=1920516 RepID=UPI002D64A3B4|nr:type II toxin-antitoxin system PemK/MazF family toxin [Actinocrinis sp.]HZU54817.1 type II toxin-antitoxin system PemK/MazF family toxin [Actinocrinis sp.]
MNAYPMRGQVFYADVGDGDKPFLVVSNNRRNQVFGDFLVVRMTTTPEEKIPEVASVVETGPGDPLVGRIRCDDIVLMYRDELKREAGALTRTTMQRVAAGLMHALAI